MAITWLADVLRAAGLTVIEHANWKTYDRPGDWNPQFFIIHATAAPKSQLDSTQVSIVRDGRSDLNGPIANACVDRSGRWHVLSAGRCNTTIAGTAGPYDGKGNTNALGIEACNDNAGEPWPDVQYDAYVIGVAAIAKKMGWTASQAVGHKEHTPGHKTDPTFSMTTFRANVTKAMKGEYVAISREDKEAIAEAVVDLMGARMKAAPANTTDEFVRQMRAIHHQYSGAGLQGAPNALSALADTQTIKAMVSALTNAVAALSDIDEQELGAAIGSFVLEPLKDAVIDALPETGITKLDVRNAITDVINSTRLNAPTQA